MKPTKALHLRTVSLRSIAANGADSQGETMYTRFKSLVAKLFLISPIFFSLQGHAAETWQEMCVIPNMGIKRDLGQRVLPADLAVEKSSQALLLDPSSRHYSVLKMPQCRLERFEVPYLEGYSAPEIFFVPGGQYLYNLPSLAPDGAHVLQAQAWSLGDINTTARSVQNPPQHFPAIDPSSDRPICRPAPILSNDGLWTAWIERVPDSKDVFVYGQGTHFSPRIAIRSTSGKQGFIVALPEKTLMNVSSCKAVQLMALDMKKRALTVSMRFLQPGKPATFGSPRFFSVDIDRSEATQLAEIPELKAHHDFRQLDNGWVAWGATDNSGTARRIVWSLPSGRKTYDISKTGLRASLGSSPINTRINMVSVSPDGKWLAVSFSVTMGRGVGYGKTYVLRTEDSRVLFEHSEAAAVAFIGNEFFAYDEYDSQKRMHQVRVLKVSQH